MQTLLRIKLQTPHTSVVAYDKLTGEIRWKSPVLSGNVGYVRLYPIEPDPTGFKSPASVELLEAGTNWAPLALVDGKLLIRDQKSFKCLAVAK